MRRIVTAALGLFTALVVSAPADAGGGIDLRLIGNFSSPTYLTYAPGDESRLFVVERAGRIRVVKDGITLATPFLDIVSLVDPFFEGGLLGLAFHPDYQANGLFYVSYTAAAGFDTTIAAYQVSANPDVADPASANTILTVGQPAGNHNAGWIGFGPHDGLLYIPLGDGGGSSSRSQDITDQLLGKILRIDVNADDFPADPDRDYAIPPTNPYVGVTGDDETYGLGLRNPYRCSFDRATGDLWLGDVGGGAREEANVMPHDDPGAINFGWGCMEGELCTGAPFCTCNDPSLTLPVHAYDHGDGCVITGGSVYRGCALPALHGTYFFVDFCSDRIWSFEYVGGGAVNFMERTSQLPPVNSIVAISEDAKGELYFVSLNGTIHQLIPQIPGGAACPPEGDLNGDGVVSFADILVVIGAWGPCGFPCPEDLNGDGVVGFADILVIIANWTG
ncbi:MAG: PQQ-dependent sugar dehydrogenase [Planctomycetota bacterium]|jgi:glucose/arabinose dehydrogenase